MHLAFMPPLWALLSYGTNCRLRGAIFCKALSASDWLCLIGWQLAACFE